MLGVLMLAVASLLAACSATTTVTTREPALTADAGHITRGSYGPDWPFAVDAGTLSCQESGGAYSRPLVTFDVGNGIKYALNGAARDFGFPEVDRSIVADYPDVSGLGPVIKQGLALC